MIVSKDTDFIGIVCAANKMAEAAHTAYWLNHVKDSAALEGEAPGFLIQEDHVIQGLRDVAGILGFRLERVEPATLEAAE